MPPHDGCRLSKHDPQSEELAISETGLCAGMFVESRPFLGGILSRSFSLLRDARHIIPYRLSRCVSPRELCLCCMLFATGTPASVPYIFWAPPNFFFVLLSTNDLDTCLISFFCSSYYSHDLPSARFTFLCRRC